MGGKILVLKGTEVLKSDSNLEWASRKKKTMAFKVDGSVVVLRSQSWGQILQLVLIVHGWLTLQFGHPQPFGFKYLFAGSQVNFHWMLMYCAVYNLAFSEASRSFFFYWLILTTVISYCKCIMTLDTWLNIWQTTLIVTYRSCILQVDFWIVLVNFTNPWYYVFCYNSPDTPSVDPTEYHGFQESRAYTSDSESQSREDTCNKEQQFTSAGKWSYHTI